MKPPAQYKLGQVSSTVLQDHLWLTPLQAQATLHPNLAPCHLLLLFDKALPVISVDPAPISVAVTHMIFQKHLFYQEAL